MAREKEHRLAVAWDAEWGAFVADCDSPSKRDPTAEPDRVRSRRQAYRSKDAHDVDRAGKRAIYRVPISASAVRAAS